MQDILEESLGILKRKRIRRTRMTAILLTLSLLVSLDVFWTLRQPGLTLAGNADCGYVEHIHDDSCQNGDTTCPINEHTHTIECYSDETADVETQLNWQEMFEKYPYTDNLNEDLVGIAKTQVGYSESTLNFQLNSDGIRQGYTRYGAWYGTPYGNWSATFVSFCLHYAGADEAQFPINTGADSMAKQWEQLGRYVSVGSYKPVSGDLVFFNDNTVGIVTDVQSTTCYVIRGDVEDTVQTSLISFIDSSIKGWGLVNKSVSNKELYNISNGPAVHIFADGNKEMQVKSYATRKTQVYSLRSSSPPQDLLEALDYYKGSYIFVLSDANDLPVPKDENGNYIIHAETLYKITLRIMCPDGIGDGNYVYNFPSEAQLVSVGDDDFIINGTTNVGSWAISDEDKTLTLNFNEAVNNLSDVIISATVGVVFPRDSIEVDFDGKIHITVEPPREEIETTELLKWGEQGNPDNIDILNKEHKLDPTKIYWTVQIQGNQDSDIPGNGIIDQTFMYDGGYEHYYSESDRSAGLKFGVSVPDPDNPGNEIWHSWMVYPDQDPNLTWGETGWQYVIPETVMCTKNANNPHLLTLGNNNYTYYVEYTSTPKHVDIAGKITYYNVVEVDNQTSLGSAGFTQNEVKTALYKNGTLVTDAGGAKIVWEINATIPKKDPEVKAEHDWKIGDDLAVMDPRWNRLYFENNQINISSFTANYFGTTINVPHFTEATENDPYAYYSEFWSNGASNGFSITILQRCACTKDDCGEWDEERDRCNPWVYKNADGVEVSSGFCDCWRETEDTTFTIVYETDVTEEIEKHGGMGHFVYNYSFILNDNNYDEATQNIILPGVVTKQDYEKEGTIVNYTITVNEAKLNLTDGAPLIINDEMAETLAFMRGSLVIKTQDAAGNEAVLEEGVDYSYTYDGSGDVNGENGKPVHILKITIDHPQPVTYVLDYRTSLIAPRVEDTDELVDVTYTNTVNISLWSDKVTASTAERVIPNMNFASKAFSVFVHKRAAEDEGKELANAEFGLFNEQGGLIAKGYTDENGILYFRTDVKNGIVLREHKIYYIKELTPPPGYELDEKIYKFTFCSQTEGTCDVFEQLDQEHDLMRVKFNEEGHIDVTNKLLYYDLPSTGGIGIYPFILVGSLFIAIPLVYRFIRRRKRERRGVG